MPAKPLAHTIENCCIESIKVRPSMGRYYVDIKRKEGSTDEDLVCPNCAEAIFQSLDLDPGLLDRS